MSDDRDKLLQVMNSLDADYKSGKISKGKYRYFRSKYEDKLNSIDAIEASRRIRSMQGKPDNTTGKKRNKRPVRDKRKQEQDLVQKYIINPKKDDAKYQKKKKSSMDGGTFTLVLVLILVIAFTAGIAYGIFNFDFETGSDTTVVAVVQDTAFPEIHAVVNNTTKFVSNYTPTTVDDKKVEDEPVETTTETTTHTSTQTTKDTPTSTSTSTTTKDTSTDSKSSDSGSNTPTPSPTPSDGGGSDSGGGSDEGGGSDSGGGDDK